MSGLRRPRRVPELFVGAIERADLRPTGEELVLDGTALTFIDHRGLLALAGLARRHATTVVLRTPLRMARRVVELLGVEGVRVEHPG